MEPWAAAPVRSCWTLITVASLTEPSSPELVFFLLLCSRSCQRCHPPAWHSTPPTCTCLDTRESLELPSLQSPHPTHALRAWEQLPLSTAKCGADWGCVCPGHCQGVGQAEGCVSPGHCGGRSWVRERRQWAALFSMLVHWPRSTVHGSQSRWIFTGFTLRCSRVCFPSRYGRQERIEAE